MTVGPFSTQSLSAAAIMLSSMLKGEPPFPMFVPFIDVRDAAVAHVNAMTSELGDVSRIALGARSMWTHELQDVLRKEFEEKGYNVSAVDPPNTERPTFELTRMRHLLKVEPRPIDEAVVLMATEAIKRGLVTKEEKTAAS